MKEALPRVSMQEICVLKLLWRGPRYGLQIVDDSAGLLSRRAIYVILHRMTRKKLITRQKPIKTPSGESGPERVPYQIAPRGARALMAYQAWISERG